MSNRSGQSGRGGDPVYWLIAIGLLITGFAAPIGVIMIVIKLLGGKKRGRHPYYTQQNENPVGARTTGPVQGAPAGRKRESRAETLANQLSNRGKRLTLLGGIFSAIFGLTSVIVVSSNLWVLPDVAWFLEETLPILCFFFGGLGCLWVGLRKRKEAARYRGYLAMVGSHTSISISALASAAGSSPKQVREDLADMLEDGFFPGGFLDLRNDLLVVSGSGLRDEPEEKQEAPQSPPPQEAEDTILAEIRAVNDAVDNEKLSAQIDRIGVITAKILDYQRSHPEKSPQLHSFLSYYLPTTLKILRAYGQLEDQEISGENITAAMRRIEGMMDKVVEGFEKQLDQLFQGDAMDITADVEVLERMLAKDGLSDRQGLTLGL